MSSHAFVGTWEVLNYEYLKSAGNFDRYVQNLEGIRVKLDENGDATWTVPEDLKSVPLFSCETYEIYRHHSKTSLVIRFGAYAGHVFEFTVDKNWTKDNLRLTCESSCTLQFSKVKEESNEVEYNVPFTLLQALEDGYFADLTIVSANKKEFKVHTTILRLQGDDIDWTTNPPPFSNLPEDVLGSILHFLYAECLPENLSEDTAKQVISAVVSFPSLKRLMKNCEIYLKNMALKQQIIGLVNDMHSYINQVIDRFQTRGNGPSGENIASNPSKLCFVVKQSIRDFAVVGVKLLLLCDLFTKRRNELSRNERHEIIRYAKSRLPVFLNQLTRFLQALKNTFSPMSPTQRFEVATFLVPEIEVILDTLSMLIVHVEKALNQIMQGLLTADVSKCKSNVGDMMSKTLKNILHIREWTKLNTLHDHITCSLGLIVHKKGHFNQMSSSQKVRAIARNLEQLTEELPIFLIKLEETAVIFDEKLEWRDFKFCFKVATSKVSDILQKLIIHTDSLQEVMQQLCELVQRTAFSQTLRCLGLLSNSAASTSSGENLSSGRSFMASIPKHGEYKFNLVEALCTPLDANNSLLSELCLKLLNSPSDADMEFEITGIPSTSDQMEPSDEALSEETCILKSHRVIVAARCDWFRRALLSGMREAINRKIVIHDTSPFLFKIFLEYLYSGRLQHNTLTAEQLVDLLLLSDRYEMDSLKHTCEYALLNNVDNESVLYFLSMADQYNASILKSRCLKFIFHCQELTESEEFLELPISLQAEVYEGVWTTPPGKQGDPSDLALEYLLPTSSASSCNSSDGVTDLTAAMESMLLTPELEDQSNASSMDYLHFEQNSARLDTCISQLRDIVGDSAPREELVQVILAADFDMRRAVNYYYARCSEEE